MIALYVGDIDKAIRFIIQSAAPTSTTSATLYNLSGSVVTLLLNDGSARTMSIVSAASAVVQYVVSALDFQTPTQYEGQLRVSQGSSRFFTSTFALTIKKNL